MKTLPIILVIISFLSVNAQIKVTPGGDFAIGQNYITSGFKTEINGERKVTLGLNTRQDYGWGWASISKAINPYTKHWIVSQNGYNNHNFFVYTSGLAFARTWYTLSDGSIKENIHDINNASELISALKPKYYTYTKEYQLPEGDDTAVSLPSIGFIAQDIQKILPQLVAKEDSAGLLRINYQGIIPLLVKHAQEQDLKIKQLEDALKEYIDEMDPTSIANPTIEGYYPVNEDQPLNAEKAYQAIPNPNTGSFKIQSNLQTSIDDVIVTNLIGELVDVIKTPSDDRTAIHIHFTNPSSGVYIVHIIHQGKIITSQKVLIND